MYGCSESSAPLTLSSTGDWTSLVGVAGDAAAAAAAAASALAFFLRALLDSAGAELGGFAMLPVDILASGMCDGSVACGVRWVEGKR